MFWFKKKKKAGFFHVPSITFVGEQDGVPEQELKSAFITLLAERNYVNSAYLARVAYGHSDTINVALCISVVCKPDKGLTKALGEIFAGIFNTKEHLDIVFISNNQEVELKKVCRPFYEKKLDPEN